MNLYSTCIDQFLESKKATFSGSVIIHGAGDGGKAKRIFDFGGRPTETRKLPQNNLKMFKILVAKAIYTLLGSFYLSARRS